MYLCLLVSFLLRRNVLTYWDVLAFDVLQTSPTQLLVHHSNVGLIHKGHVF